MADFRLEIRGNAPRQLREAIRRAGNPRTLWRRIGRMLLASVDRNFQVGGRPKWRRRKRPANHNILDKSGKLRASPRAKPLVGGVEISSPVVYAATHQFGRTEGRGSPIPARPFLDTSAADEDRIGQMVEDWVTGPLR